VALSLSSSGPAVINTVSAFVIREVVNDGWGGTLGRVASGFGLGSQRELVLMGRGLPYRPLTLKTQQRLSLTWLPGYSVATAQALGAKEDKTSIRGKWSDKFLAKSQEAAEDLGPLGNAFAGIDNAIGQAAATIGLGSGSLGGSTNEIVPVTWQNERVQKAYKAAEIVDELVRTATYVEVLWDNHARRGYITEFTKDWHNAHDLEWEMEFTWVSRSEPNPPVTAQELSLSDTVSLFQKLADALNTEALPPTFPMTRDVLADVDAGVKRIAATSQAVFDTVGNTAALATAPFSVARSVMALSSTIIGQADALRNRLRSLPVAGLRSNRAEANPSANAQTSVRPSALRAESSATFSQATVCAEYVRRVDDILKQLIYTAIIQRDDYARKLERQVTAIVNVREGQDLRDLATQYYGNPHEWKRIAQANGLRNGALVAGMSIVIPKFVDGEGC
jgi:nucleoid-associated protein YgaU